MIRINAPRGVLTIGNGTEGADQMFADGPGAVLLQGKRGDDRLTTPTNGMVRDLVYGDNAVSDPALMGAGDDILDLGPNDIGRSGMGDDLYWIHGPGDEDAPTIIFINLDRDRLIMSGEVDVARATFTRVREDRKLALLDDVLLRGDSDNPITDDQHVLMRLDSRREPDMPRVWIPYDGQRPGLDDVRDWWHSDGSDVLL